MEAEPPKRAILAASLSLLIFSGLTTVALVGWFYNNPMPWTWKSVLATACAMMGVTVSALVWRAPSRMHASLGIGVMVASLARIGAPDEWTWVSFTLVAVTFVLLMPLVNAAIILRPEEE